MTNPRTAIITGASSGIGRAAATELAARSWGLVLLARRPEELEKTASLARECGATQVQSVTCDLSDLDALPDTLTRIADEHPQIHTLINNAGMGKVVPLDRTDRDLFERTLRLNTVAPAIAIRQLWPNLARAKGRVINVSSYATDDPFPGFFAYGASKGALDVMTKSIANEGEAVGIRAFSIAPGAVETAMLRSAFDESVAPGSICLEPADVARVIADCAEGQRDADNARVIYVRRAEDGSVEVKVQPRMSEVNA